MIDLQALRKDPTAVITAIHRKDPSFPAQMLVELDQRVRSLKTTCDELAAHRNDLARQARGGLTDELRTQAVHAKQRLEEAEHLLAAAQTEFEALYLRCPNVPFADVPSGNKEANTVIATVGTARELTGTPKNHLDIMTQLGWVSFEDGARLAGAGFPVYRGQGVRLMHALSMFMVEHNRQHGYEPVYPSYLVSYESMQGAGNFPRFLDEVYACTADNLYLIPTAEVALANLYRDQIIDETALPIRLTALTGCFRREAGGYGAMERGMIRMHQFEKAELFVFSTPDQSMHEHERMLACAEGILKKLDLHYRVSLLAAQDCSFSSAKTYDIEVWLPGQKEYREVSSVSNCTDFQARRTATRYRATQGGKPQLVHTLNGSSLALSRLMVALVETYQQPDGSVALPECLKTVTVSL